MGNHEDRRGQLRQDAGEAVPVIEVQGGRRLVEEKEPGLASEDTRHGHEPLFAKRQLAHGPAGQARDPEAVEPSQRSRPRLLVAEAVVDRAEGHVLDDGRQQERIVGVLPDEADAASQPPDESTAHRFARDAHDARPGEKTDHAKQQRRLPCAIGAEEEPALARGQLERDGARPVKGPGPGSGGSPLRRPGSAAPRTRLEHHDRRQEQGKRVRGGLLRPEPPARKARDPTLEPAKLQGAGHVVGAVERAVQHARDEDGGRAAQVRRAIVSSTRHEGLMGMPRRLAHPLGVARQDDGERDDDARQAEALERPDEAARRRNRAEHHGG
jgi:hypothetical protein